MVLECVMLCIDNSEFSRNGDYSPSRYQSEVEACSFIASQKLQSNPETSVGLLSLAGFRLTVHVSPCRSSGAIMSALAKEVKISGQSNFIAGLKTAALALKNRQNKNQRQRIIAFVGSPLVDDVAELVRLGKTFKKNNIAVDLINFGAENAANENPEKLEKFIESVNSADNSHLVNIPPGPHILADLIMSSPICVEGGQNAAAAAGPRMPAAAGAGAQDSDIDPNLDPEMAMAIRMSLEEDRLRQQRAAAPVDASAPAASAGGDAMMEDDEEKLLQQAIAMSMQQDNGDSAPAASDAAFSTPAHPTTAVNQQPVVPPNPNPSGDVDMTLMQDPDFLASLLSSVGASPDASAINELLDKDKNKDDKKDNK